MEGVGGKEGRWKKYLSQAKNQVSPRSGPESYPLTFHTKDLWWVIYSTPTVLEPCLLILPQLPLDGNHQECNASNNGTRTTTMTTLGLVVKCFMEGLG